MQTITQNHSLVYNFEKMFASQILIEQIKRQSQVTSTKPDTIASIHRLIRKM